jgi:hypothetical protein
MKFLTIYHIIYYLEVVGQKAFPAKMLAIV